MPEEFSDDNKKKVFKIGLILLVMVVILILAKIFIFKSEPLDQALPTSPEEVAIQYLQSEEGQNREEAEKYLISDKSQVEILGKKYQSASPLWWINPEKVKDPAADYQVRDKDVQDDTTNITIEAVTNKMEDSIFFSFVIPKKLTFEVILVNEEGQWKITKVNSPNLVLESSFGEKTRVQAGIFIKPIKFEKYSARSSEGPSKFFRLQVEFENNSFSPIEFTPLTEWRVVDKNKDFYTPGLDPKGVTPAKVQLKPNSSQISYVFFEIPKDFVAKEIIFENSYKRIIFQIETS